MEEITAKDKSENLSFKEELTRELSPKDALLLVIPFTFNQLISVFSDYFESKFNQYLFLFAAMTILWTTIIFLERKKIVQFSLKLFLPAVGIYILFMSAFNWIKLAYFEPENPTDKFSSALITIFIHAASLLIVWLVFKFLQKVTKN